MKMMLRAYRLRLPVHVRVTLRWRLHGRPAAQHELPLPVLAVLLGLLGWALVAGIVWLLVLLFGD